MSKVIKPIEASRWLGNFAALVFGIALTGCGGGSSSGDSGSQAMMGSRISGSESTVQRTAALSWNAPLQRQNSESLTMNDLAGYVINYGQDPEDLDQTVYVNDAYVMKYTVNDLSDGTWYFSVQAKDSSGLISPPSELVSKKIQG
jgi:hypothetical protein